MTYNPYHQDPNELALLQGATIQRTGVSQEGFPYLLVEKQGNTFYLFVQSDAEGNSAGYLSITERSGARL